MCTSTSAMADEGKDEVFVNLLNDWWRYECKMWTEPQTISIPRVC